MVFENTNLIFAAGESKVWKQPVRKRDSTWGNEMERATETDLPEGFTRMTAEQLPPHIILRQFISGKEQLFTHLQKLPKSDFPWMMEVWWLFARVREELKTI